MSATNKRHSDKKTLTMQEAAPWTKDTGTAAAKEPRRKAIRKARKEAAAQEQKIRHQRCLPMPPVPKMQERGFSVSESSDSHTHRRLLKGSRRQMILRQWAKSERMAEENDRCIKRKRPLGEYPFMYRHYKLPTVPQRRVAPCSGKELEGNDRRTMPAMSKFDVQMILQNRLKQLWQGDSYHPDCPPHLTRLTQISEWELFNGKLEGEIIRKHPNGDYERWRLSELKLPKIFVH